MRTPWYTHTKTKTMENNDSLVKREYERDSSLKKRDVEMLLDWLESQPHLPKMNEQEVIWFLKSCYYSNEAAKDAIDSYFTMKTHAQELLGNVDFKQRNFIKTMDVVVFSVLPTRTHEEYSVVLTNLLDVNTDNFFFNECVRFYDMVVMLDMMKNGTTEGVRCCFDMKGVSFTHIAKLNIISVKKFLLYLQEGLPIRLKGIHFFNITPVMDRLLMIIKPFLKKEVLEVLKLHQDVEDMKTYVPIECLPSDYGGEYDSLSTIQDRTKKEMRQNEEYFIAQNSKLVDESQRPGKPKNVSDIYGVEGTFKKLDID